MICQVLEEFVQPGITVLKVLSHPLDVLMDRIKISLERRIVNPAQLVIIVKIMLRRTLTMNVLWVGNSL